MRAKLSKDEMREIQEKVEKEFPDDPALQEVHFARKLIAKEAQGLGRSLLEHVRAEVRRVHRRRRRGSS